MAACGCRGSSAETKTTKQESDPTQLRVVKPGTYGQTLKLSDDTVVSFTIAVPKGYSADKPIPLVIVLHYGANNFPMFFGNQVLRRMFLPAFHDFEAIYVAPDAVGSGWTNEKSESNVIALVSEIFDKYNIDREKVLLTGFSLGGHGTWHLASRHQDIFTAAVPVAGRPSLAAQNTEWRIPLYVIHSNKDEVVTVQHARDAVSKIREQGANVQYFEVEDLSHYDTSKYIEHIRTAIPWLKQNWKMD